MLPGDQLQICNKMWNQILPENKQFIDHSGIGCQTQFSVLTLNAVNLTLFSGESGFQPRSKATL